MIGQYGGMESEKEAAPSRKDIDTDDGLSAHPKTNLT